MKPFRTIKGRAYPLGWDNVDTDLIIPAGYLKVTDMSGLGAGVFEVVRAQPGNPFSDPRYEGASILIAGRNFGCGSSREHAVWALQALGIRTVIATSFAEIFRENALKNGLLPVALDKEAVDLLLNSAQDHRFEVDLERCRVSVVGGPAFDFEIDSFRRECLLQGRDDIGSTLELEAEITAWERQASPSLTLR